MTVTRRQRDSETRTTENESPVSSERTQLLTTCQQLFAKDLADNEIVFWRTFLPTFSLAELHYAFEHWNANGHWFPKPKDIGDLCEAYRIEKITREFPIGCERCDWTGFYTVRWNGVERFVAECPCRTNVSLRTKCQKKLASRDEMVAMLTEISKFAAGKKMEPKPQQISGIIPTTLELAQQLARRKTQVVEEEIEF